MANFVGNKVILSLFLVFSLFPLLSFCGGGSSSSPTTPSTLPISIEALDGASDVSVTSTFQAKFSQVLDTSTVTASSYFLIQTPSSANLSAFPKGAFNTTLCQPSAALAATISCSSTKECLLDPTLTLSEGTNYTLCLTTGIKLATGSAYDGYSGTFTTTSSDSSSGTSSAAPKVSVVKDAKNSTMASSGTTGIFPTTLNVTFSKALDDSSATTSGNMTLTCTDGNGTSLSPTISVAASTSTANTYVVTVTDPWRFALMNCILTVTTGVKNSNGTALASAATYSFTNACAINDDFMTNSQDCWSTDHDFLSTANWATLIADGILSFDTENG